jgi:hypothetical protein
MSLKAFHIIFITASTILAFGFGAWSLIEYFTLKSGALDLILGSASVGAGFALIVYGKYFLKKLKHISYL